MIIYERKGNLIIIGHGSKKVCIVSLVIPPNFSGAGVRAYEYALRLNQKNKLAFIITQRTKVDHEDQDFKFKRFKKLSSTMIITVPRDVHKDRNRNKNKLRYFFPFILYQISLFCIAFWKIFQKRNAFSIMHCMGAGSWLSLYSVLFGKILGKKTVLEMTLLNSDDPISIKNNSRFPINRFRSWLFSKADIIISISPALSRVYKLSGMPIEKLREVPNSVDTEKFCPVDRSERINLRKNFGYSENQILILCVGAIIKRKGIDLLVKSFSIFRNQYPNAMLLLVGPIPKTVGKEQSKSYSEYLEIIKLIDDSNLKQVIRLMGTLDNVEEYMKISDLFVFLSRNEGLPNALLEAMSTGLPVIALQIPGITEYLIQDKIDGIIVNKEDPNKIALEMDNIFRNYDLYNKISINSRNTIMNKFTNQMIDNQYEDIYKEISKLN